MGIRVTGDRVVGDWPKTASERAVEEWIDKIGLKEARLLGYEIKARANDVPVIKLELVFNEDVEE